MSLEERLLEAAREIEIDGTPSQVGPSPALLREAAEANRELVEGLRWYEQMGRDCRKIHREGEVARRALDHDGGDRARALIAKMEGR